MDNNNKIKLNQKYNSIIINENSNYFKPYSNENSRIKNDLVSFEKKQKRNNRNMDNKSYIDNCNSNSNKDKNYLFNIKILEIKVFEVIIKQIKKK